VVTQVVNSELGLRVAKILVDLSTSKLSAGLSTSKLSAGCALSGTVDVENF
jgi:hypothetical protein